jgi:hypothetical protein
MKITSHFLGRGLLALLAALTLTGCRVLEHRHVQRDFEDAVRAESAQEPFNTGYEYVLETVTPEYIAKLDSRLRPNAWMMRGMAAWRLKEYTSALECYTKGEQEPALVRGSRDDIVLNLLPALVIDSEQMDGIRAVPGGVQAGDRTAEICPRPAWSQHARGRHRLLFLPALAHPPALGQPDHPD